MAPPNNDHEPSEEEWRARTMRSKKAPPRRYKPTTRRTLAPRPTPPSTPRLVGAGLPTIKNEPESPVPTIGDPPPDTQTPQFGNVTAPQDLTTSTSQKIFNSHETNEYARVKRQKFLREVYSGKQASFTQSLQNPVGYTEQSSRVEWKHKDLNTPTSMSDEVPDFLLAFDSKPVKTEPVSTVEMPISPPLSRTRTKSIVKSPLAEDRSSNLHSIPSNLISVFSVSRPDPFDTLSIKFTSKMETLINCFSFHCHRSDSTQPFAVFSSLLIPDRDLVYAQSLLGVTNPGSLHSVFPILFRLARADPPLLNTLLFIGEFASRGLLTEAALEYQGSAMRLLNEKLRDPKKAMDNASIATILFLSGFEYIKGNNRRAHEAHMQGLLQLLKMRDEVMRDEVGSDQLGPMDEREVIERGLFWSDLLGAVLLGSQRFFSLNTFTTLRLLGSISRPKNVLPPGFIGTIHMLDNDLIEIIRDICDFQEIIESQDKSNITLQRLKVFNDRKASIEYRLASLDMGARLDGRSECCRLAVYLFSSATFPPMFGPPALAAVLSSQLAHALAQTDLTRLWDEDMRILLWLCFIGASHWEPPSIYTNVLSILLHRMGNTIQTWEETVSTLKEFLWSETVFEVPCRAIWETLKTPL